MAVLWLTLVAKRVVFVVSYIPIFDWTGAASVDISADKFIVNVDWRQLTDSPHDSVDMPLTATVASDSEYEGGLLGGWGLGWGLAGRGR